MPACEQMRCACAGGANVPAMNDLLAPYGIAFGDAILEGQVGLDSEKLYYASGANIVRFPARGHVHGFYLADKATSGVFATTILLYEYPA